MNKTMIELARMNPTESQQALVSFEQQMLGVLNYCGLPSENILVDVKERVKVFSNVEDILDLIERDKRINATYISKFLAAASSGLFDAALNYLWDETVIQLRQRVINYDIQYFYDNAVQSPEKRKKLKDIDDLVKIDDSELINGAKEIDLISEMGYKHLDFIKYMRNWASAAHPNQVEITGLQLITWLETCIKEVINLPESKATIEIGKLLKNIKAHIITEDEAEKIGTFFHELQKDRINALVLGFFGIYTRMDTKQDIRKNIHLLLPKIWERVDESVKNEIGIKYARYEANNDQDEAKLARNFLQIVEGEQYLPEPIRAAEIEIALVNLKDAHNSSRDNFYKEPSFAKQLQRLAGTHGIPVQLDLNYVKVIVEAFLSNGNGVCWEADDIYLSLINNFNERQLAAAVLTFAEVNISSKLQFSLCRQKYLQLIDLIKPRITSPAIQELIQLIQKYPSANLSNMKHDSKIQKYVEILKAIRK